MENFDYRNYLKNNPLLTEESNGKVLTESVNEDARTDAEQEGYKDGFKDAKKDIKSALKKMKVSELKNQIRERILSELAEAEEDVNVDVEDTENVDVEKEEDVNVDVEKEEDITVDDTETETDIEVDTKMPGVVDPNITAIQGLLTKAQATSKKLGDNKLLDQIGNTITYFTRAHVVGDVSDKEGVEEILTTEADNIPTSAQTKINQAVKDPSTFAKAIMDFVDEIGEKEQMDFSKNAELKRAFNILRPLADKSKDSSSEKDA